MALDRIAARHNFGAPKSRFRAAAMEGRIGTAKVLGLKPATFMNSSGDAVAEAVQFYKLSPGRVIVIYDELDLAPGKMKVKKGGGAAGHNGIRSIDAAIGPDFWRVRIGIGHPGRKEAVLGYVLHAFAKTDRDWLDPLLDAVAEDIETMIAGQSELFMTKVAARLAPPKPLSPRPAAKPAKAQNEAP
jgi:PTH1 family peptidyl-tRNA hydrolase